MQNDIVHVAVAVIQNSEQKYLITKRALSAHQGGLWEFPGGKLEPGETVQQALKREIFEELGLNIESSTPLIRIKHDYTDKTVLLDVWQVEKYCGNAKGNEGQALRWVDLNEFSQYNFPAANYPIIKAIELPDIYMITGEFTDLNQLTERMLTALNKDIKLVQFRAHHLQNDDYFQYAKRVYEVCEKYKAKLLLNTSLVQYMQNQAYEFSHGLHLTSKNLISFSMDIDNSEFLISASVHNQGELKLAEKYNLDFVVLSPVKSTTTHPDAASIGWKKFEELTEQSTLPVYALGGMTVTDIATARKYGGQGISAISALWV